MSSESFQYDASDNSNCSPEAAETSNDTGPSSVENSLPLGVVGITAAHASLSSSLVSRALSYKGLPNSLPRGVANRVLNQASSSSSSGTDANPSRTDTERDISSTENSSSAPPPIDSSVDSSSTNERIPHFSEYLKSIPIPPEIAEPISRDFCIVYHPLLKKCCELEAKLDTIKAQKQNGALPIAVRQQMDNVGNLFEVSASFKNTSRSMELSKQRELAFKNHAHMVLDMLIDEKSAELEHHQLLLSAFTVESYSNDLKEFLIATKVDDKHIAAYLANLKVFFDREKSSHDEKVAKEIELKRKKKEKDMERRRQEDLARQQKISEENTAKARKLEEENMKQLHTTVVSSMKEKGFAFTRNPLLTGAATSLVSVPELPVQSGRHSSDFEQSSPVRLHASHQPPAVVGNLVSLPPPPKARRLNDYRPSKNGNPAGPYQNQHSSSYYYEKRR